MKHAAGLTTTFLLSLLMCMPMSSWAQNVSSLALDKGCYNCHGNPPRKNTPSFDQLAETLAKYRGQTKVIADLAEKLHKEHVFGGIKAHEQLSPEQALLLVTWITDGAK